jgi:hypothetical protein
MEFQFAYVMVIQSFEGLRSTQIRERKNMNVCDPLCNGEERTMVWSADFSKSAVFVWRGFTKKNEFKALNPLQ